MYFKIVTLSELILAQLNVVVEREEGQEAIIEGPHILNYFSGPQVRPATLKDWLDAESFISLNKHLHLEAAVSEHNKRVKELQEAMGLLKQAFLKTIPTTEQLPTQPVAFDVFNTVFKDAARVINAFSYLISKPEHFTLVVTRKFKDGQTDVDVNLLCMSASVAFSEISRLTRSVILTSGTLKTVQHFCTELGTTFRYVKTLPHVISVEKQLFLAFATKGASSIPLTATYKASKTKAFRQEVGDSLLHFLRIIASGVLVFLPSYSMMSDLHPS